MSIYVYPIRLGKMPCNPIVTREYIKIMAILESGDTMDVNLTLDEAKQLNEILVREIDRKT